VRLLTSGLLILPNHGSDIESFGLYLRNKGWGWDDTEDLVYQAIKVGFRNFQTGNHERNRRELEIGPGIRKDISERIITREEIFVSLLCYFSSFQQSLIQLSSDSIQVHHPPEIAQRSKHS
jgi:hypothetical protein